jgi:uncharacterized membrane protein
MKNFLHTTQKTLNKQFFLILIITLAAFLRLYKLGSEPIWLDEAASYYLSHILDFSTTYSNYPLGTPALARVNMDLLSSSVNNAISLSAVWNNALLDRLAPLHFFVLHFTAYFGKSEFALRLPSAIFGLLTIPLIYKTGEVLFGRKEGLFSAFLLSISFIHIYYSQEARAYSMMTFFSLLSIYYFYMSLEHNNKYLWAGFVISTSLAFYSYYYTVFLLITECLFYVIVNSRCSINPKFSIHFDRKTLSYFAVSIISILLLISPLLYPFIEQSLYRTSNVPLTWGLGQTSHFFNSIVKNLSTTSTYSSYIYVFMFFTGIITSLKQKKKREKIIFLALIFGIPLLAGYILSAKMPFVPRYVLFVLPAYLLIISRGITGSLELLVKTMPLRDNYIKILMNICLIIMLLSFSFGPLSHYYSNIEKEEWGATADYVEASTGPEDIIVLMPNSTALPFFYYYEGANKVELLPVKTGDITSLQQYSMDHMNSNGTRIWYIPSPISNGIESTAWLDEHAYLVKEINSIHLYSNYKA